MFALDNRATTTCKDFAVEFMNVVVSVGFSVFLKDPKKEFLKVQ